MEKLYLGQPKVAEQEGEREALGISCFFAMVDTDSYVALGDYSEAMWT